MFAAAVIAWLVAVLGDRALGGGTRAVLGPPDKRALAEALTVAFDVAFAGVPESSHEALSRALEERFSNRPWWCLMAVLRSGLGWCGPYRPR